MEADVGRGMDAVAVAVKLGLAESGRGTTCWRIDKWDEDQTRWVKRRTGLIKPQGDDFLRLKVQPYAIGEALGNVITNAGWQALLASATGTGTPMFTTAKGRIGVGNGTTAVAAADTDLSALAGSTNRWFQFPAAAPVVGTGTNRTWVFTATFGTADGNFAWQEFGIDQGTASGNTVTAVLFNHALSAQGTKASGQTWTATATMSFT